MNILEIIPQLYSGGAERFTVDLCNELSKRHDVTLMVFYDLNNHGFYQGQLSPNVKIISLNKRRGFSFSFFIKIISTVKSCSPDIVHMHLRAILYLFPSLIFYRRAKYFMTIHNTAEKEAGGFWGALIRKVCFRTRLVTPITISDESRRSFNNFYGIDAPIIFNGRDIPSKIEISDDFNAEFNKFRKSDKTKVIVNLARINPVKRQPLLAKVASQLYREGYDFSVLMIGNDKNQSLVNEIKSYNCPAIHILGEKTEPLKYLYLSDAFCLCSSYEGMPISVIEALGVGTVPICTPVGGIVDVIKDGENGFLAKDLSEDALYEVLKRFFETSEELLKKMRKAAKASYAPFSMKKCAEKYESLFNEYLTL